MFKKIKTRNIYKLVERPEKVNMIGVKWVYALKFDSDRVFMNRKSRIIAKGYS